MFVKARASQLVATALVLVSYYFAREPQISSVERNALSSRFKFQREVISIAPFDAAGLRTMRKVHPSLERIKSWISATGAAATLADLDGDGFENDLLLVDTRVNQIIVQPCPGTGDRFAPFTLTARGLSFNDETMSPTGSIVGDFNEDGNVDVLVYYWGRTPILFMRQTVIAQDRASPPSTDDGPDNVQNDNGVRTHVVAKPNQQLGDLSFEPKELLAPEPGQDPQRWFTHAATQADIDGDGHLDLIVGNFFQDGADILNEHGTGVATVMHAGKSKAKNGGGAKLFLWQSAPAGMPQFKNRSDALDRLCGKGWVLAAGAADLDLDGLPEIYLAHDFGPDRLLHNRSSPGDPKFELCEGVRTFTTPKSFVLGKDSFKGMGMGFGDVNGDGFFDIYVSNIADEWALQESHFLWTSTGRTDDFQRGVAPYVQSSERYGLSRSGWGWDSHLVDFDNDGKLDAIQATGFAKGTIPPGAKLSTIDQTLYDLGFLKHGINRWPELQALGTTNDRMIHDPRFWPKFQPPTADLSGYNTNPFYARSDSGRFENIAIDIGIGDAFNTRGIAVADVDGDGRLDFVYANQYAPSVMFHNESSPGNAFLGLNVFLPLDSDDKTPLTIQQGPPTNIPSSRRAIGAIARLRMPDGTFRIAQADGGSGHSGHGSQAIHFGLGKQAPDQLEVELRWRAIDGTLKTANRKVAPGWNAIVLGTEKGGAL